MFDIGVSSLTALISYLVGGIPFGYLIARSRGVDLFHEGSGNIGATNVGRVLGKRFGILVFLLDFGKGAVPVLAARFMAGQLQTSLSGDELGVIAGLAAILGHLFSVYLRFRGGKGVATGAGVVFILLPLAAFFGILVWIGFVAATRYVSLASLAAAATLCVVRLATTPSPFAPGNLVLTSFCFAAAGLVLFRHRTNIQRLLSGKENQLKDSQTMQKTMKVVHVMALGLWFGMVIFFSFIVGPSLFNATGDLVKADSPDKDWFQVPMAFQKSDAKIDGRYEYGTRIAGNAISPMFNWYFLLQGICGFLAIATAWGWQFKYPGEKVHRRRVTVLLIGLLLVVLAGWPLEHYVSGLREVRHEKMNAFFFAADNTDVDAARAEALDAKATFGLWHMVSLLLNFITMALVAVGMALCAFLPQTQANDEIRMTEARKNDEVRMTNIQTG